MDVDTKKRHDMYGLIIIAFIMIAFIVSAYKFGKEAGYKEGCEISGKDSRSEWYAIGFEDGYKHGYEDCYEGRSYDEFNMIDKMK